VAAYWHPIRLAGEAAMCDLLTDGRRIRHRLRRHINASSTMAGGLKAQEACLTCWRCCPSSSSCGRAMLSIMENSGPSPRRLPAQAAAEAYPSLWAAVRNPVSFDWAVANDLNVMTWALTREFAEVELYMQRFRDSGQGSATRRPRFSTMRHTGVYGTQQEAELFVNSLKRVAGQFENLFAACRVNSNFPSK
jgi:alkanesulfonate monooxygenase SsuD/methylene tetrahydromethanopterin reductase-like flavin-dependent oxidoreductase (luciferase family)